MRKIKPCDAARVLFHLRELGRLRKKAQFKNRQEKKKQNDRKRIRYHLQMLRVLLPHNGEYNVCHPEGWEIEQPNHQEIEQRRAEVRTFNAYLATIIFSGKEL
jgi:hypothetical protein